MLVSLKIQNVLNGIESRFLPCKKYGTVTCASCKAFPIIGMMGYLQAFSHAAEEDGMAAWDVSGTKRMVTNGSRLAGGGTFTPIDCDVLGEVTCIL